MQGRKLIALAASAVLATLFCGCGGSTMTGSSKKESQSSLEVQPAVAKVLVISGQSNASGFTYVDSLKEKIPESVFKKYEEGFDNAMIYYNVDTPEKNGYTWPTVGNNTSGGKFVKVKLGQGHTKERFGPEIGIAERLREENPDDLVYIIKCSWGSASLFNDFASPSMTNYTTSVYYDKFVSVVKAGLEELKNITDLPIELRALCWAQGEKDSAAQSNAMQYGPNLQKFVGDFRAEFADYKGEKEIAFIDAELGINEKWTCGDIVNQHKAWFTMQSENNYSFSTLGLSYSEEPKEKPDVYHYDSLSMLELGYKFAEVLIKIF